MVYLNQHVPLCCGVGPFPRGNGGQKLARVGVLGIFENGVGRARLDDLTLFHDHDLIGDVRHHRQVMGYEQYADIPVFLQVRDQAQDLGLNGHVQSRGGLIGNQQARLIDQGHGDHHTLSHAPGKLVGEAVEGCLGTAYADFVQ